MIQTDDIVVITQNIVTTMLGANVELCEWELAEKKANQITGNVQIAGAWRGVVFLQASEGFARRTAEKMFRLMPEEISYADIQDAFAEITNMIGGNIKGQVPGPSVLSIPTVTTGEHLYIRPYGTRVINDVGFICESETLRVIVCEELQRN
jgi:chemotaxis protein CheX